jgi:anti-sigma B factor antagonist
MMKTEVKDGVLVISLNENILGYSDTDKTLEWLKGYFRTGIKQVVIDLTEMQFLNSVGLGKLVQWITKYNIAGGKIVFCNLSSSTEKLIKLTRLEQVIQIFPDETSAIKYLTDLRKGNLK